MLLSCFRKRISVPNGATGYSHVGDVLEDEGLVDLGVAVLPVDLGLVLGLLVRQQVDLDEGVSGARGPIRRRQVLALDDLNKAWS